MGGLSYKRQIFNVVLIIIIMVTEPMMSVFHFSIIAYAENRDALIRGYNVNVREDASTSSRKLASFSTNTALTITGEKMGNDGHLWYSVFINGLSGYVRSDYIKFPSYYSGGDSFENLMAQEDFPESYKPGLRQLHAEYPSWIFKTQDTGLRWEDAVKAELEGANSLVDKDSISSWKSLDAGKYDWNTGKWKTFDGSRWVAASREIVSYYMDPRNFFDETGVFQFLIHDYDPNIQNIDGLRAMLKGTFMDSSFSAENDAHENIDTSSFFNPVSQNPSGEIFLAYEGPGAAIADSSRQLQTDTPVKIDSNGSDQASNDYAEIIMKASSETNQNPYVLAAMILQEQGQEGKSESISGRSGYYNFFNIGAYAADGMSPVERGLWYASQNGSYGRPWNTIEKAIVGGAAFFSENYLKTGQNTLYLKKWNVQGNNPFKHQYMTNVQGAAEEGAILSSAYRKGVKDAGHIFLIPVYQGMPDSPSPIPTANNTPSSSSASEESSINNNNSAPAPFEEGPGSGIAFPGAEPSTNVSYGLSGTNDSDSQFIVEVGVGPA